MKHHLSLLCFALTSFFLIDKAVANLLLKQNPTPLEPASYASSGESYQLAKVTWLPDYLGDNKSYGNKRVDDGGSNKSEKNCATYGLLDSCGAHRVGKGTQHPIAGLTCYEECVCDTSYYKYTASNCRSPKKLSAGCSDIKKPTIVDSALVKKDTVAELSKTLPSSSLAGSLPGVLRTVKYAQCNCPAVNLAVCTSVTTSIQPVPPPIIR